MYRYIGLFVALAALVDSGLGQVTVDVTPATTQYLKPGDTIQLQCVTNQKIDFILENEVSWFFHSMDADASGIKLTQTGKLLADDTQYRLNFDHKADLTSNLDLLNVSPANTGKYTCKAGSTESSVEVVVVMDVHHVEMKIDDNPPIIGEEINPYEAEFHKRKTKIECTATGSYPQANIRLFVGDQEIPSEEALSTKLMENAYKSFLVVRKVLYPKHTKLQCIASVNLPADANIQVQEKVSSIPLHIITLEPLISCKNQTASMQDKYVTLECDVSAEKPVTRLYWRVGYNNQIIYPGNKTEDYDEVRVEQIEGSDINKRVVLDIYKMKKEHFDSVFYLIVEDSSGKIYQEPVYIREFHSSSSILRPCLLTLLVLSIIGLVKW